jgi:lysophospholipase
MRLHISTFATADDGFMRWACGEAQGTRKGTVLVLPGWAEWLEKYENFLGEWQQRHFDTVIMEWRGQGLSSRFLADRRKSWIPSLDVLVEDLDRFFTAQITAAPEPVIIFAHSMGAHLALRWWMEKGHAHKNVSSLILCSIMHELNTDPFPLPAAKAIATSAVAIGADKDYAPGQSAFDQSQTPFEGNRITHDRARYEAMMDALRQTPDLKVGGITFGWLKAVFDSTAQLQGMLLKGAPRKKYLVLGAANDTLVTTEGVRRVASLLPNCESHFYDGAGHELLQESELLRLQVWIDIDRFIGTV